MVEREDQDHRRKERKQREREDEIQITSVESATVRARMATGTPMLSHVILCLRKSNPNTAQVARSTTQST